MSFHVTGGGIADIRKDPAILETRHTLAHRKARGHGYHCGGQLQQPALMGQEAFEADKGPPLDGGQRVRV